MTMKVNITLNAKISAKTVSFNEDERKERQYPEFVTNQFQAVSENLFILYVRYIIFIITSSGVCF